MRKHSEECLHVPNRDEDRGAMPHQQATPTPTPPTGDSAREQRKNAARVLQEATDATRLETLAKAEAEAARTRQPIHVTRVMNTEKIIELRLNHTSEEAEATMKQHQKFTLDGREIMKASAYFKATRRATQRVIEITQEAQR